MASKTAEGSSRFTLGVEPTSIEEAIIRTREKGFWPVWEGITHRSVHRRHQAEPLWLSVEAAERKYDKRPRQEATLVFREMADNTNQRTCLVAVLPPFSVGAHTLSGVLVESVAKLLRRNNSCAEVGSGFMRASDVLLSFRSPQSYILHSGYNFCYPPGDPSANPIT